MNRIFNKNKIISKLFENIETSLKFGTVAGSGVYLYEKHYSDLSKRNKDGYENLRVLDAGVDMFVGVTIVTFMIGLIPEPIENAMIIAQAAPYARTLLMKFI